MVGHGPCPFVRNCDVQPPSASLVATRCAASGPIACARSFSKAGIAPVCASSMRSSGSTERIVRARHRQLAGANAGDLLDVRTRRGALLRAAHHGFARVGSQARGHVGADDRRARRVDDVVHLLLRALVRRGDGGRVVGRQPRGVNQVVARLEAAVLPARVAREERPFVGHALPVVLRQVVRVARRRPVAALRVELRLRRLELRLERLARPLVVRERRLVLLHLPRQVRVGRQQRIPGLAGGRRLGHRLLAGRRIARRVRPRPSSCADSPARTSSRCCACETATCPSYTPTNAIAPMAAPTAPTFTSRRFMPLTFTRKQVPSTVTSPAGVCTTNGAPPVRRSTR